jgi:S-(hydroxymethyl)glutathione dehydrogenase/alcohol dehydrogenase
MFNEPLKVEDLKLKAPRADEIVVKMAASGVCHSDLSVVEAKLPFPPPVVLGHEGAGVVEEVGKDVQDLQPGDHVVLTWVENCGRCHYCIAGRSHLCDAGIRSMMEGKENVFEKDGVEISRMAGIGSFAERSVVRATAAVKIRQDAPLDKACLIGCGVTTGVGAAMNTVKVRPGQTVAVFGCGGVGLNVIQGSVLCGAARVIAVDVVESKLAMAKQFGATDTINGKDVGDVGEAIRSLTDGIGVDYAFEVIGMQATMTQAFMSLKRGGAVVVVGVTGAGEQLAFPGAAMALEEKSVIGSLYGSANLRRDMPALIDLYMDKRLKLDELISRRIKLDEVNAAFDAMRQGEVARSVIAYD